MTTPDLKNLCLYCFNPLDASGACPHCKKRPPTTANPPHHLPRYTVLNKKYLVGMSIGEGGFGITYLGYDLVAKRTIAIKEYYPNGYVSRDMRNNSIIINSRENYTASNRGLKRFIDEAKNLNKINNLDGIVKVLDFFSANNTAYIIMEYLDGMSLKRYVSRKRKLTMNNTLAILKPVISSLKTVHEIGLIHRDISPDNIIITKNNQVKLIDFGASKLNNLDDAHNISIVLKQGFAPEEQYRSNSTQGAFTDIYALGVTIYFCITGTLPPESLQRLYTDNLIPPSKLGADISYTQEQALLKCMAVFAKDRYQTIEEMEKDLYFDYGFSQSDIPITSDRTISIQKIEHPSITINKLIEEQNKEQTDKQNTIQPPTPPIINPPKIIEFAPRTTLVTRKQSTILQSKSEPHKEEARYVPPKVVQKPTTPTAVKNNKLSKKQQLQQQKILEQKKKHNIVVLFRNIFKHK